MAKAIRVVNKPKPEAAKADAAPKKMFGHAAERQKPYEDDEGEVLRAAEAYKVKTGRKFLAITDMLAVMKALGYRKAGPHV